MRLPDDSDEAGAAGADLYTGPLPQLAALDAADALRRKRRGELMLDDACLATTALDCRATVPARVYAFYALSALTLGVVAVVGGMAKQKQERLLKRRPPIVVGTPGRLWDLYAAREVRREGEGERKGGRGGREGGGR